MFQQSRNLTPIWVVLCLAIVGCGRNEERVARVTGDKSAPAANSEEGAELDAPMAAMARMPEIAPDEGIGPEEGGDQFEEIIENPFRRTLDHPLSTFSVDVDTASYAKVRQYLLSHQRLPRPDAVRIEELLNYFAYDYAPPTSDSNDPFATHIAVTQAPWNPNHRLARIALKGRTVSRESRPPCNLVFLVDTSGSMKSLNKLPLLKRSLGLLLKQLNENDRVSIVAYAGSAGVVLDSTPASETKTIMRSFVNLSAGGSTNGGEGLSLAYKIARENKSEGSVNRVLLCTDGDFNVGQTSNDQLLDLIKTESADDIELSVLGYGMGNFNDAMLEKISGSGNGNYAFIDSLGEARKVLEDQLAGTLVTIAKDVKLQVEFNPAEIAAYRLIGYENRMLQNEDFNDDKKDAGEIGAGHSVTAFYELIPTGVAIDTEIANVDSPKYVETPQLTPNAQSGELLTLKLRYKLPEESESRRLEFVAKDASTGFEQADGEFRFAAAVAGFGMLLRESEHSGQWTFAAVNEIAQNAVGSDPHGLRKEFLEMVAVADALTASR